MEGSVLSPTSWEKRRAWLRQSRHWQTQVLEEEAAAALQDVPDPEPSNLDDVFQEGNPITKIEDWLQDCGYSEEGFFEEAGQSMYNGGGTTSNTLGAPAPRPYKFLNSVGARQDDKLASSNKYGFISDPCRSFLETARPCQLLNLGCSLASSSMTGGTNKTSSRINNLLMTPQTHHLQPLYPGRFKQVQTLAVTADAFFCLYSYVSKTPVQKFTPSHMLWNYNPTDVPSIKILAPEPEPHSPRERLRKAISKMCLYTCPRDRLSSPHNDPKRNSLDQVVWEVMDRVRGEKMVLQQDPEFGPGSQEDAVPPINSTKLPTSSSMCPCVFCPKEETQQGVSTAQAPSQTLHCNPKTPCCTHSLPRADLQWSTDSAQVKRELWSLQATNREAHSAKDETFWKRKSKARKSLFPKNPMGRKVKSLDLSIFQQKCKESQQRPGLHRSLTQLLWDNFDLEEVQWDSEEESCWPSRPRPLNLCQTFVGKGSRSRIGHEE
ncbi:PREDICTED: protein TESPA1 [Hipposideros armiger]|uniref:Protein TESPA1 n=1 Tax=Hipposideros armiger TaxID=186990 RepID=A0A8B7SSY8_HIPAR|nr:PREDICTED: protein TESPA1 [Hipposideros armiger]